MRSIQSNDGIFQVVKKVTCGGLYYFKSYNNDHNIEPPKIRPHLLVDDGYGFARKYKFLAVTSTYIPGSCIPIVSNSNSRLSFISLSSIIDINRTYVENSIQNDAGGATLFFKKEFADMCKYIYAYKQLDIPIEEKYVIYLDRYLKEYNRMVDQNKLVYEKGEIPHVDINDIINQETIKYCTIVKDTSNIIDINLYIDDDTDKNNEVKEETKTEEDTTKYDKDIIFIRDCIDPDHDNSNILKAFDDFKNNRISNYKELAAQAGIEYRQAYYYTKFINNEPAINRSIAYRNKLSSNDINSNVNYSDIDNTLSGCKYKIKHANDSTKVTNRRGKRKRRRK